MADSDIERMLEQSMATYQLVDRERRPEPVVDLPMLPWRPQGAYPSDYGRYPMVQDYGPEWDFRPADERWD